MHLNYGILLNRIYAEPDTTFYKHFSIHCFVLRWRKGEGFHHHFQFLNKAPLTYV